MKDEESAGMRIAIIAAVSENGVIGVDGRLPWHLPEDLKRFKRLTLGKPVIMGRKTYDSIGRLLPGRPNVIVTRQEDFAVEGAHVVGSLDAAFDCARDVAPAGCEEVMVIGGAEIYRQALPHADVMYLTKIHEKVDGDTCFPDHDALEWQEMQREERPGQPAYSFVDLHRIRRCSA